MEANGRTRIVRRAVIVLVATIAALAGGFLLLNRTVSGENADLRLIKETTGIQLPAGLADVDIIAVNYGHLYIVAHVRVPRAAIPTIVARNGFTATPVDPRQLWSELLSPPNYLSDGLVAEGQWRYLSGERGDYDWVGMLDEASGRLWLTLIPTCDPVFPTEMPK